MSALLCALLLVPHPNSLSTSRLEVDGARATLTVACQTASVLEVIDADADGDLWIDPGELEAARADFFRYLGEHYVLRAGDALLAGRPVALGTSETVGGLVPVPEQWVHATVAYEHDAPIDDLLVEMTLFFETSPRHRDLLTLVWHGETRPPVILWMAEPRYRHASSREPAPAAGLLDYGRLGWEHILTGWDHLAFLLALLVAAPTFRALLATVTAFTVAHSLTLALATLEVVRLDTGLVEVLIAASIVVAGAENLVRRRPHAKWPEAFGFGLVHGLGFASFLSQSFLAAPSRALALLGFNLGVEVGQVAAVAAVVVVLRPLARDDRGVVPGWFRWPASVAVTGAGLLWLVRRLASGTAC